MIFAEPTTITGSIGIFGIIPTFENTLAKIGVTTDGVKTTPLSGQPDIYRRHQRRGSTRSCRRGSSTAIAQFLGRVSPARGT